MEFITAQLTVFMNNSNYYIRSYYLSFPHVFKPRIFEGFLLITFNKHVYTSVTRELGTFSLHFGHVLMQLSILRLEILDLLFQAINFTVSFSDYLIQVL